MALIITIVNKKGYTAASNCYSQDKTAYKCSWSSFGFYSRGDLFLTIWAGHTDWEWTICKLLKWFNNIYLLLLWLPVPGLLTNGLWIAWLAVGLGLLTLRLILIREIILLIWLARLVVLIRLLLNWLAILI